MKESGKTLRAIANQAKTGATLTSGSSGSGSGHCSGAGLVGTGSGSGQASARPGPPLAIEDAKEADKLMLKGEEAVKGTNALLLKAAKAQANLPATGTGKKSKAMLADATGPVEVWEPKLKHLAIHGCWPGHSQPPALAKLSDDLKDCAVAFEDLKQSLEMAAPLLRAKDKQE